MLFTYLDQNLFLTLRVLTDTNALLQTALRNTEFGITLFVLLPLDNRYLIHVTQLPPLVLGSIFLLNI